MTLLHLRILLLLAVGISFYYNLHAVPLFDLDEGAFSEATREMLLNGDYISTYLNNLPRYDKPILIYWLQAISVSIFGLNEFALRLPSALAATAWVFVIYWFLRKLRDEKVALIAAVMTATALEISIISKAATADALLNLFLAAEMLLLYLYYIYVRKMYLYLVFFFMGLGVLTKGPVAILIPLVVSFIFFSLKGKWRDWLHAAFNIKAWLIFLAVAMPWYVLQYIRKGDEFIQGFIMKHNVSRFNSAMETHDGNYFYFIPIVLLGVWPFTTVLLKLFTRIKPMLKDDLSLYMIIWFGFVFVFFSFSATKLPHYIIYGFTALIILMALRVQELKSNPLAFLPPVLFVFLILLIPVLAEPVRSFVDDREVLLIVNYFIAESHHSYLMVSGFTLVLLLYAMFEKRWPVYEKLLISGVFLAFTVSSTLMPIIAEVRQKPIKEAALLAKQKNLQVVFWKLNTPSFNVYSESISERREPKPGEYCLTHAWNLTDLNIEQVLYEKHGIVLIKIH